MNTHTTPPRDHQGRGDPALAAQVDLFIVRAREIYSAMFAGRIALIDATDLLFTAAEASGLADAVGHDVLQKVMVASLASASSEFDAITRKGDKP